MELTSKVNQNRHFKAKVLFFLAILSSASCTTLDKDGEKADKTEEIYNQQVGIVINHLNMGEPDRAHFETRSLLRQYPDRSELHNLMGLSYMGLKRPKLAERFFRQAFEIKSDPAFGLNLTSAMIEQGNFSEALKLLRKFKQEDLSAYKFPERFDHNMGLTYEKMRKTKLAIKHYRDALARNPSNYQTLMQIGRIYQRQNKLRTAEPVFRQAIEVCLKCFEPLKRRSDILVQLGRKQEALQILLDYVERTDLRPTDVRNAKQYLSQLDPSVAKPQKAPKK